MVLATGIVSPTPWRTHRLSEVGTSPSRSTSNHGIAGRGGGGASRWANRSQARIASADIRWR